VPLAVTLAEFGKLVADETERWTKVVKPWGWLWSSSKNVELYSAPSCRTLEPPHRAVALPCAKGPRRAL
jgi:hypothetical protein